MRGIETEGQSYVKGDRYAEQGVYRRSAGLHGRHFPVLLDIPALLRANGGNRGGCPRLSHERFVHDKRLRYVRNACGHCLSPFRPGTLSYLGFCKNRISATHDGWNRHPHGRYPRFPCFRLCRYRGRPYRTWFRGCGPAMGYGVPKGGAERRHKQLPPVDGDGRWRLRDAYVSAGRRASRCHDCRAGRGGDDVSYGAARTVAAGRSWARSARSTVQLLHPPAPVRSVLPCLGVPRLLFPRQ